MKKLSLVCATRGDNNSISRVTTWISNQKFDLSKIELILCVPHYNPVDTDYDFEVKVISCPVKNQVVPE